MQKIRKEFHRGSGRTKDSVGKKLDLREEQSLKEGDTRSWEKGKHGMAEDANENRGGERVRIA